MEARRAEQLELLLGEFDRLGVGRQVRFDTLHLYSIITHSTAIEGSTVTLEENTVMFDDGVVPAGRKVFEQMMNLDLRRAYDVALEVASARTPLSLPLLKAFSSLVMRNTGALYRTPQGEYDEAKGDLRLQNVSAGRGGRSYLAWEKVEQRTAEFVSWLNAQLASIEDMDAPAVYDLSFEAHYRLVTIHPWSDGNGRVARLIMNLVQMEGGVVPSIVRSERKAAYIRSLEASRDAGTSAPFLDFMTDETLSVLALLIDDYQRDLASDVPWSTDSEAAGVAGSTPTNDPHVAALIDALGRDELSVDELRSLVRGIADADVATRQGPDTRP